MPHILNRLPAVLAVLSAMCFCTSAYADEPAAVSVKTVVIDAGHGGHDPGTVYGSVKEKDINLSLALKVGSLIKSGYPGVKVIYTRTKDVFVPLVERSAIANRNKADLFISIHINSAGKSTAAYGTETFIMGTDKSKSNMELCKRENSVITLEADYTTTYAGYNPDDVDSYIFFNLMQSAQFEQSIYMASKVEDKFSGSGPIRHTRGIKQAPLLVLWQTTMPSVLIEAGFLSSPLDRKVLTDESSRDRIAECIYSAFSDYKKHYDPGSGEAVTPPSSDGLTDTAATGTSAKSSAGSEKNAQPRDTVYRIQILASKNELPSGAPELKGVSDAGCVLYNGYYKYTVGNYKTRREAAEELPKYRSLFEGAFIVRMDSAGNFLK